MVVISGPEATAGSTFSFLNIIGMTVPAMLDKSMDTRRATPVHREIENAEIIGWPLNKKR